MASTTYGGKTALDPVRVRETCLRLGLPVEWFGRPNQWATPLGVVSGQGWVLLTRADLDELGLDTARDLTFAIASEEIGGITSPSRSVTHRSLHPVQATCLTPGLRDDPAGAYLVELADRRRLYRAVAIDTAYNIRSQPGGSDYFEATLNSGSPWTWTEVVQDIWETVGTSRLGSYPGLPYTPDGNPESLSFYGWYGLDALAVVLDRLGCSLKLDTTTDTFSIVRLGVTDTQADQALSDLDYLRISEGEYQNGSLGRYPQNVRVLFPRHRVNPDTTGGSPWYGVDVTDPSGTPSGVETGTCAIIYDDLPAVYDSTDTLSNAAALATRAAERAADWFRRARMTRRRRTFSLPLSDSGLVAPGSQIKAVRHGDRGAGLVTEVGTFPGLAGGNPFPAGEGSEDLWAHGGSSNEMGVWSHEEGDSYWFRGGGRHWDTFFWNPLFLLQQLHYFLASYSLVLSTVEICGYQFWCLASPSQWTGDKHNFVFPAAKTVYRVWTDASRRLTGMVVGEQAGEPGPQVIALINIGSESIVVAHQSGDSTAANRIIVPGGQDLTLAENDAAVLWYDTVSSRWRILATTAPIYRVQATNAGADLDDFGLEDGCDWLRLDVTGDIELTGLTGGVAGRKVLISNVGSGTLTLADGSTGSLASNRLDLSTGANHDLAGGSSLQLVYDATSSRWRDAPSVSVVDRVRVSATDTTPGFLQDKLVGGDLITITQDNGGANETLTIDFDGLTVEDADGVPSYTGIKTIIVDQADGCLITQPGAGQVRFDFPPASRTSSGMVDTSAQQFAGSKRFENGIYTRDIVIAEVAGGTFSSTEKTTITPMTAGGIQAALVNGGGVVGYLNFDYFASNVYLRLSSAVPGETACYQIVMDSTLYEGQTATTGGLQFTGGILTGGSFSGVTSVSGGTTGLTFSGGSTPTMSGTLVPANGGTGLGTTPPAGTILVGTGSGYAQASAVTQSVKWGLD